MEELKDERSNFIIMLNNLWVLFLVLVPTAIIYSVIIAALFTVNTAMATIFTAIIVLTISFDIVKGIQNKSRKKERVGDV